MKAKLTSLFLLLTAPLLHAQSTPALMSYQGRVTDVSGVLIGNTAPVNRAVTFKIYSASSGGTPLYAETQSVTISGGEFSVLIGNGTGISTLPGPSSPASTPYKTLSDILNSTSYTSLYLGVTVDDGTAAADLEISPRQQLVSGAFSLRSKVAESVAGSAITTAMVGDQQVTTNKIAASAVDSSRIADLTIDATDIKNSTITSAKLDTTTVGVWTPVGSSVYRNNNVGIGESNPGFPLNFNSTVLGDRISLWGNSGAHYGFGIQSNLFQIHTSVSTADIAFGYGTSASMTETMRIKGNGNVGIGNNSPGERLVVAGTASADKLYSNGIVRARGGNYGANGTSSGFSFDGNGDSDGGMFSGADGILQFYTNGAEKVRLTAGGNLGIGTSNPGEKLSIQDGKLWFTTSTGNGDTGGIGGTMAQNDFYRIFGAGDNDAGALYIDTYDAAIEPIIFRQVAGQPGGASTAYERMRIAANGFVGINQSSPAAPLHVSGYGWITINQQGYLDWSGGHDSNNQSHNDTYGIYCDNRIAAGAFDAFSDARIKTDLSPTDSAADLDLLLGLEITNYHYKDTLQNGNGSQKKVIAQQVESVFPQAVTRKTGIIPDILKGADVESGWILLATDLQVGEKVRLLANNEDTLYDVLEVRDGAFRTKLTSSSGQIFVYGRQVADLRTVDYDAIAMLNVSATQQIKWEKDAEINELKHKNAELEARLAALEKLIQTSK